MDASVPINLLQVSFVQRHKSYVVIVWQYFICLKANSGGPGPEKSLTIQTSSFSFQQLCLQLNKQNLAVFKVGHVVKNMTAAFVESLP